MRLVFLVIIALFVGLATRPDTSAFAQNADLRPLFESPLPTSTGYVMDQAGLKSFYASRDFKPVWAFSTPEGLAFFTNFLSSIERVIEYHGLNAHDYPLQKLHEFLAAQSTDDSYLYELMASDLLLRLAHNLHGDENNLSTLYPGWSFQRAPLDLPPLLAEAIANGTLSTAMGSLAPVHPTYAVLADALATYRTMASKGEWPLIDKGPSLRPHDHNKRVAQLRARLMAEGYYTLSTPQSPDASFDDLLFDEDLEHALMNYQEHNGLTPDGHIGQQTLIALNTPVARRIDQITANMERWRHMPDNFPGALSATVNIAAMTLLIADSGTPLYQGPVVIGRYDRRTPFVQSDITMMIINPSWHVPLKIAQKDILPKLREDPHYLENLGISIRDSENDPHGINIDWKHMTEDQFDFRLRQDPGDQNSLGHVKFSFENPYAVYMHGTPHQELFAKSERALSSGCIRLRDPNTVAEVLTSHNKEPWLDERLDAQIDTGDTKTVRLSVPMPLNVVYWTVFPDSDGRVAFRKDIYEYDHYLTYIMTNHPREKIRLLLQPVGKKRSFIGH